jgi:flagellar hook assembly protein FlgD
VRTLVFGQMLEPGAHTTRWDGRDTAGNRVASGVYWIRLEADGTRLVRSAVLVR